MSKQFKNMKVYIQQDDQKLKELVTENGGKIVGFKDKFTHYISSKTYDRGIKIDQTWLTN